MRTLKAILEVHAPKSQDERKFVAKHVTLKHADPAGNGDDVFQATNIKSIDRKKERKGFTTKEGEKVYEETEQVDEKAGYSAKSARAGKDIGKPGKMFSKIAAKAAKKYGSAERGRKVAGAILKKLRAEEVEQVDELNKPTLGSYINKAAKNSRITAQISKDFEKKSETSRKPSTKMAYSSLASSWKKKAWKREEGIGKAVSRLTKEEVEQTNEVLKPSMGAGKYVSDFVKSDDPRFKGSSKKERIQRALAAYYAAKRKG